MVAIVVTISNSRLWQRTRNFFPENIDIFTVKGKHNFFGLDVIMLAGKSIRLAKYSHIVFADEDVFFSKNSNLFGLIEFADKNKVDVLGVPDNGPLSFRQGNHKIPNLFFTVIKNDLLRSATNILASTRLSKKINNRNISNNYDYSKNNKEPYYILFEKLHELNANFYFLRAEHNFLNNDYFTSKVFDHYGDILLFHTWYARSYGFDNQHTNRINKAIELLSKNINHTKSLEHKIFKLKNPSEFFYTMRFYRKKIRLLVKSFFIAK